MICFPLDNTRYEAKEMGAYLCTRTRGVFSADDNLVVSPGTEGLSVMVSPGIAWFKWSEYWGTAAVQETSMTLNLDAADGALDRIDVVVGRLDKVGNLADISIRKGAFSSAPTITDPVRDESADEIYLSSVRVRAGAVSITAEDITDMRLNEEYCGLMRDGVTGIPTAQLQEQVQALIDNLREVISSIEAGSEVMLKVTYGGSADGVVSKADSIANPVNIGNALFDGSAPITLEQMGAAPANINVSDISDSVLTLGNGLQIEYGTIEVDSANISSPSGSLFTANYDPDFVFKKAFASAPLLLISWDSGGTYVGVAAVGVSATGVTHFTLYRGVSGAVSGRINYIAIGMSAQ